MVFYADSSINMWLFLIGYFSWLCAFESFTPRRGEQPKFEVYRFRVWLNTWGKVGKAAKLLLFPQPAIGLADISLFWFLILIGGFGDLDLEFLRPFWNNRIGSV